MQISHVFSHPQILSIYYMIISTSHAHIHDIDDPYMYTHTHIYREMRIGIDHVNT